MTAAPSCSLDVIFARDCSAAIIFRRGPTRSVRLIAWDRATDAFEPGQWMRGARVHVERCDLSPDGKYLLTFIATYRPPLRTYTVLSYPPYFTALSLWPKGDTWGGGGRFLKPRDVVLFHAGSDDLGSPELAPGFQLPPDFKCRAYSKGMEFPSSPQWFWIDEKAHFRGIMKDDGIAMTSRGRLEVRRLPILGLRVKDTHAELEGAGWADFDSNGDWLFSIAGRLYRLPKPDIPLAMKRNTLMESARLLADFSDMRFEQVPPPYPSGFDETVVLQKAAAYQPVLDRVSKEDRRRRTKARKTAKSRTPASP